ncbi:juvenile hormone acid O-methyltransferase-like isoform X2 [Phlebotomus argentipes]|uniref:juvenile hormone acid O-methyltransferase-like isoform X2 n=1 Tax=Phlebotomus argentipes TaxID=94469 RepID=UPI0028931D24|nr:juvenile hormone acid O-methyltransferase-like isoform X2 [Phlebotomus argentipes]
MSGGFDKCLLKEFSQIREHHTKIYLDNYGHLLTWKPNEFILDIGCGSGDITHKLIYPLLPEDFQQLVCSDISGDLLEVAEIQFKGIPKVSFDILDICSELKDHWKDKFNHIFSLYCLMWVKCIKTAFRNIYSLLANDGECFLIFVDKHDLIEVVFNLLDKPKWAKFVPNPGETYPFPYRKDRNTVETIINSMKSAGFCDIRVHLETIYYTFKTEEEFLGFFKSLPNPMHLMTAEEHQEYLKEAVESARSKKIINEAGEDRKTGGFVQTSK